MSDPALGLPGPQWRAAALVFNTQPLRYLHDSWCAVLPHGDLLRRFGAVPAVRPQVARELLRCCGLDGTYCTDFASPWARLALLDGAVLVTLFTRLGLALRAASLRQELGGEPQRRLRAALTAADWHFLTRRVPLLGALPIDAPEPWERECEPRQRFAFVGLGCCRPGLARSGPALTGRLALKLPAAWAVWSPPEPPALRPAFRPNRPLPDVHPLLPKLIKDLAPECHTLFA